MMKINKCPTCGSDRISRVRRDVTGEFKQHIYRVKRLSFYECPNCGERLYDREAMQRIEVARRKETPRLNSRQRMRKQPTRSTPA